MTSGAVATRQCNGNSVGDRVDQMTHFAPTPRCPCLLATAKPIQVLISLCLSSYTQPKGSYRRPRPVEGVHDVIVVACWPSETLLLQGCYDPEPG